MTIRILNSAAVALSTAVLLSACGGGGSSAGGRDADPSAQSQGLVYAYPGDGQTEVSTAAPVILRFSEFVSTGDAILGIRLFEGDANGREMDVAHQEVLGEPSNVVIVPADDDPFKPNQQYTVVIQDLSLTNGDKAQDRTLHFTTRALHKGPKEMVVTDMDEFNIVRTFPSFDNLTVAEGQQRFDAMDFSSFRLQMSQPVDADSAVYGQSVKLTYGIDDEQVPATLLVDGRYLTVDPEPAHLDPTQSYTLTLTGDLASTYGANFSEQRLRFKPKDTSPRGEPTELVQRLTVGGRSKLTGRDVNQVPVNGTLLGEDANITQARADSVVAELGDATRFPETLPIRLPKGTVLKGDEISPIMIGGKVAAGFGSGDVTMTLLSDATGYMVENPYSAGGESANRMIHLMMDVGIATAEPRANGAFTQDLLHIELMGMADVDTDAGVLNVDAVSMVEPDILGQEFGYGLLSFQLQSYEDQTNAPQPLVNMSAPVLQSWMPGDHADLQKPGDPIVLNFNKAIAPSSVEGRVSLYENSSEVSSSVYVDGSAIVVVPTSELKQSTESQPVEYQLVLQDGITDMAGNGYTVDNFPTFQIARATETRSLDDEESSVPQQSPLVLAVYPGYPCALTETDLGSADAGRCAGSFPGIDEQKFPNLNLTERDYQAEDDHLPVPEMPANRPIRAEFSKEINPDSVRLGSSFKVQKIDESQNVLDEIDGNLKVRGSTLEFWPESPWEEGELYRYVLASNGDSLSSDALCDGSGAICDLSGLPLQTNWFADITITEMPLSASGNPPEDPARATLITSTAKPQNTGGPSLVQYFVGTSTTKNVLQTLVAAPSMDTNSNMYLDAPVPPNQMEMMMAGALLAGISGGAEDYSYAMPEKSFAQSGEMLPNSARVVSLAAEGFPLKDGQAPGVNGVTIGCGPASSTTEDGDYKRFSPGECEQYQYTYMKTALNVEVTDKYVDGQGLEVLIWPSQIMSTSLVNYSRVGKVALILRSQTGPQILRMRYAEDENGVRNQPVKGYIRDGSDGPELYVDVDLYLDAPSFQENLPLPQIMSNMYSLPLEMSLSGSVRFLSDGRMAVEQINTNAVEIPLQIFGQNQAEYNEPISPIPLPLSIPSESVWLQYISSPIK